MYRYFILLFFSLLSLFHTSVKASVLMETPEFAYDLVDAADNVHPSEMGYPFGADIYSGGVLYNDDGACLRRNEYATGKIFAVIPSPHGEPGAVDFCLYSSPEYFCVYSTRALTSCYSFLFRLTPF